MEDGVAVCDAETIHERELQDCVVKVVNRVLGKKDEVFGILELHRQKLILVDKCMSMCFVTIIPAPNIH